jgi:GTP pyrophosphokinase
MPKSEGPNKPKADVESVLAEFDAKEDMLAAFCARTKSLVEAILQDANIRYQSVQTRVKTRNKLREKYLDPTKNYTELDDITDLAGLRIITYYEDEVDRVAEIIKQEFDLDLENSVDKRKGDPDKFGYNAINYVCGHHPKRKGDVEYRKFGKVRFEIQITSILRHAWAEIEHEWYDLKDAYPDEIKRRFYLVAAMLELAEREFLDIRKSKTQYERAVAVQVETNVPDLPVDAVSMKTFIEQEPLVTEIDKKLSTMVEREVANVQIPDITLEWRARDAKAAGANTVQDLRDLLARYRQEIPEFAARCQKELWPPPSHDARFMKGVSIYNLAFLLASSQGQAAVMDFTKLHKLAVTWDIAKQVAIAQEILKKYGSEKGAVPGA